MASRGNTQHTVRLAPHIEHELDRISSERRISRAELMREAIVQHLFGEIWLTRCNAALDEGVRRFEETQRQLEAQIRSLIDGSPVEISVEASTTAIRESETRLMKHIDERLTRVAQGLVAVIESKTDGRNKPDEGRGES
ncbi:MAG: hypothetical protein WCK63_15865 [Betaproteobacteria bacterium]